VEGKREKRGGWIKVRASVSGHAPGGVTEKWGRRIWGGGGGGVKSDLRICAVYRGGKETTVKSPHAEKSMRKRGNESGQKSVEQTWWGGCIPKLQGNPRRGLSPRGLWRVMGG